MKKIVKRIGYVIGCVVVVLVILLFSMYQMMSKKAEDALAKLSNVEINMSDVQDGTYIGSSDGGMVHVEVEVTVKNHAIESINLIKHDNGMGKPAEAMLVEMVSQNTDNVDVVSGATTSSKTIRNAVNSALQKGLLFK